MLPCPQFSYEYVEQNKLSWVLFRALSPWGDLPFCEKRPFVHTLHLLTLKQEFIQMRTNLLDTIIDLVLGAFGERVI